MLVAFESSTPVEVYLSTERTKPAKDQCQKAITKTSKFTPKECDEKNKDTDGEYVYATIQALKDRSYGKIYMRMELTP